MRGQREFDLARLRKRDGRNATDRILGKRQLARLMAWLKTVSKETKVVYIVSPVPVVHWTGFAVNTGDVLGCSAPQTDNKRSIRSSCVIVRNLLR